MLWDASAINGYAIEANDGRLGTVSDLLFEDAGWIIRWLVVDTGNWLPGRRVLLPLSALGHPDQTLRHFPVKLTMQQVKNGPDVDTDQPVSRQIEARVYASYGWDPHWTGGYFPMESGMATSIGAPLYGKTRLDTQPNKGDPHLRSIATITGYQIHASDGGIGHIEDLLVDDAGWSIRYIKVDTRNWWPGERVLISPHSVREIDWSGRLVHIKVNRQMVKDSPPYDPRITVDGAYEEKFLTYYGIRWVAA